MVAATAVTSAGDAAPAPLPATTTPTAKLDADQAAGRHGRAERCQGGLRPERPPGPTEDDQPLGQQCDGAVRREAACCETAGDCGGQTEPGGEDR